MLFYLLVYRFWTLFALGAPSAFSDTYSDWRQKGRQDNPIASGIGTVLGFIPGGGVKLGLKGAKAIGKLAPKAVATVKKIPGGAKVLETTAKVGSQVPGKVLELAQKVPGAGRVIDTARKSKAVQNTIRGVQNLDAKKIQKIAEYAPTEQLAKVGLKALGKVATKKPTTALGKAGLTIAKGLAVGGIEGAGYGGISALGQAVKDFEASSPLASSSKALTKTAKGVAGGALTGTALGVGVPYGLKKGVQAFTWGWQKNQ